MIFTFFLCFSYHCFILPSMFFLFCWRFGWKIAENVQGIKIKKLAVLQGLLVYFFVSFSFKTVKNECGKKIEDTIIAEIIYRILPNNY